MGLMSTDLAKPYAALRPSNRSWVLLPHNSVRGQQILLAGRTRTQLAPYFKSWCLDLSLCALSFELTYKGDLALGIPLLLHIHPSSGYIHPQQASVASTPNPLQNLQGLPNLPLISSWLELFSFPAGWSCQKPQLSRHLHLSMLNQCQNQKHQTATRLTTANNSQLTTHY